MTTRRPFFSVTWTDNQGFGRQSQTFERLANARKLAKKVSEWGHSQVTIWQGQPGGMRVK